MNNNYPLITGLGFSVPEQEWDNHRLEKIVDTSDEWIQSRTGIVTRRIAEDGQTTATLGAEAAKAALKKAGLKASDVDIIIVATMTPEMCFPATACFVQELIGAKKSRGVRYFGRLHGIHLWNFDRIIHGASGNGGKYPCYRL